MVFKEFQEYLVKHLKENMAEKYQQGTINIQEVEKNNGLKLQGLTIMLPDQNITPTVYINQMYEDFTNGRPMDDIIEDIATVFEKHDTQQYFDTDSVMDFNKVKDHIILKVVGLDANEERLQKMPHTVQEDMAFTYHIMVAHDTEGAGTIQIGNHLMESYPVTLEELHKLAMKNTAEQFPVKFQNMEEVMKEIMGMQMFGSDFMEREDMQEMMDDIFHDMAGESEFPMYVLTNKEKLNGAATLFYPGVMEQIAEKLGGDFVVLPSSLHEVLIVPDNGEMDYQGLKDMVQEVNATQVAEDEVLTDQVYSYDAMDKVFERADKKADRLAAKDKSVERKPSIMEKLKENKENVIKKDTAEMPTKKKEIAVEM